MINGVESETLNTDSSYAFIPEEISCQESESNQGKTDFLQLNKIKIVKELRKEKQLRLKLADNLFRYKEYFGNEDDDFNLESDKYRYNEPKESDD